MKVTTSSGSTYDIIPGKTRNNNIDCLHVQRTDPDGNPSWKCRALAVYPDRVDNFIKSSKFEMEDGKIIGYNKAGKITMKFCPGQVRPGMILCSPTGFRSTPIIKVS